MTVRSFVLQYRSSFKGNVASPDGITNLAPGFANRIFCEYHKSAQEKAVLSAAAFTARSLAFPQGRISYSFLRLFELAAC